MSDMTESSSSSACSVFWKSEDRKYLIKLGDSVRFIVPFLQGGKVYYQGQVQERAFKVGSGDVLEFVPHWNPGELTWQIEVHDQGLKAIAKVIHQRPGLYTLPEVLNDAITIRLDEVLVWRDSPPQGQYWDEKKFYGDLKAHGIIYGVLPMAWQKIYAVQGSEEIIIAQGKPPTVPIPPRFIDLLAKQHHETHEDQRVDYFASKITLVHAGQALAKKIPGIPGIAGINVRGQEIPPQKLKDVQFKLKKNVQLSEDGLEVLATADGLPLRMDELSFGVEAAYTLNQDLDLAVGSIEFPGDVFISGDVHDGLHIYAGGKVEIRGSTSRADIRAEKGLSVHRNVLSGNLIVGARHVARSKLLHDLEALRSDLATCLLITEDIMHSPQGKNLKPGQCLMLTIERRFPNLPKMAASFEKFLLSTKDELIQQDLVVAARTAKHFLSGLGPLESQAILFLERINNAFEQIIETIALDVPEKLECVVDYVQGATIQCAGDFLCRRGSYNSLIQAEGNLKIEGVCRGGKIISGGNVEIKELGGSGVSTTTVQFPGTKRLKVGYCYANVVVIVDKEIISIDEPYKFLEIYREQGRVEIERLRG